MLKYTLLLAVTVTCLSGQQLPALPSTVILTGAGYTADTSPRLISSTCLALAVSMGQGVYSFSCYEASFYKRQPTISTKTGIMMVLRCFNKSLCLLGEGTAGISAGAGITGAFSAGGGLGFIRNGFTVVAPITIDRSSNQNLTGFKLLVGYSWGK